MDKNETILSYLDFANFLDTSSETVFLQLNKFLGRGRKPLPSKFITLQFDSLSNLYPKNLQSRVEVILINKGSEPSFEEELASDVLEIITVFSARLYGSRSRKNKKLIENLEKATQDAARSH